MYAWPPGTTLDCDPPFVAATNCGVSESNCSTLTVPESCRSWALTVVTGVLASSELSRAIREPVTTISSTVARCPPGCSWAYTGAATHSVHTLAPPTHKPRAHRLASLVAIIVYPL